MTVSLTLWWGLISISIPYVGRTALELGVIDWELLTFSACDGVRNDIKLCAVVWKRAQEEDGDGVNNNNNDDDETNDLDEDDSFNDEMDSRVDVWKPPDLGVLVILVF